MRAIVDEVRAGGDAAVQRLTERFDRAALAPESVLVPVHEIEAAASTLEPAVLRGLRTAIANVGAVAKASLRDAPVRVELPERQVVEIAEVPVRRAAAYVPGGRAPYPSTVVMGVVTAQVAGVEEIVVCAPGAHDVILAACGLCGVDEVYAMGGAHAVAALAFGTESVPRADVIAGPGNLYVQEAKRLVSGHVGIDGFAGPSDVVVLASAGADPAVVGIDLGERPRSVFRPTGDIDVEGICAGVVTATGQAGAAVAVAVLVAVVPVVASRQTELCTGRREGQVLPGHAVLPGA